MSREVLRRLQGARAFDGTPAETDLAGLHVPFDTLTGERRYEKALSDTVRRGERVALVGDSGAGKSSVTAHVLTPFLQDVAPIRVRVGLEGPAVMQNGAVFAAHVVRTVGRHLEQHQLATGKEVATLEQHAGGRVAKRSHKVGVSAGVPWLQNAGLSYELGGLVDVEPRSAQDVVEVAQQILALITRAGLRPVLVLDDTDHWLVTPGVFDPQASRDAFFGTVVRLIAEQLPAAGAVVAVHTEYLPDPAYRSASQFFDRTIVLPPVPDARGLGRVLSRRVGLALDRPESVGLRDVAADGVLEQLLVFHRVNPSLRHLVRVAHGALTYACDADAELINSGHIAQAIADA